MLRHLLPLFLACGALLLAHPSPAQVVISEFMADNATGIQDIDRDRSDWIELYNAGPQTINLNGWYLTDNPDVLTKWRIPATNIVNRGFLLIYASGKNRTVSGQQLHTSFSLSAGGEYLALVQPDGRTISHEYAPEYPQQSPNISYGLAPSDLAVRRYFTIASPGTANNAGTADVAPVPEFSRTSGAYSPSVSVALSSPRQGTVIRYTLNGSAPTATSAIYGSPFTFSSTTVLRARAFSDGLAPSETVTHTYTILDPTIVNFNSNLPILVLNAFGQGPNESVPIPVSMMLIATNGGARASFGVPAEFNGRATIKIRGSSSTQFPKKSFALELQDELASDRKESLLGMPSESDWVLYAPYTDKTLMRDFLAYEWSNEIGRYAPRTRFVEVYLDSSGGRLSNGDYVGVYVLIEKIKRDDDRVNIAPLLPSQNTPPEVTGGYIWKRDRLDPGDSGFNTSRYLFGWVEPKERDVTPQQRSYLINYLTQFENALYSANFATTKAYTNYFDSDAAIDHHWMVELTKNIDGYRLSTFMHKDRLGRVVYGPVWDYNLTLGNANYLEGWRTNGWYYPSVGDSDYPFFRRLFQDLDFNQRYVDRWPEVRNSTFVTDRLVRRVDEITDNLREAAARNYARWPILGQYVWPNWYIGQTYQDEVSWMKWWLTNRLSWIDSQFVRPPILSLPGGAVEPGTTVTLRLQTGSNPIYFTTDGTDPRAAQGAISPRAAQYSQPIRIDANARIVARARVSTSVWSPPVAATYITQMPSIVISEIMYNPAADPNRDFEFIELKNIGAAPVDLNGFRFKRGIDFAFTNSVVVPAGGLVVLVRNLEAFTNRFDTIENVVGQYTGSLDNSGERITLEGPMAEPIHDFSYNNAWYPVTDGSGFSLVIRDATASRENWDARESWRASANLGGSPGQDDPESTHPNILVTEVLSHTDPPAVDAIELHNPGPTRVNIGNWFLSDDRLRGKKYRIPADTFIEPGAYIYFTEEHFNANPSSETSFALSSDNDEVYLFSGDAAGNLTGYSDGFSFGAAANGVSFGRYTASDGRVYYPAQASLTLGAANSGPRIGPVVISEIRYFSSAYNVEFVELKNNTPETVQLFDPARPANGWKISGIDFTFPASATIPANGLALVVAGDTAAFRTAHNVPASVPIYGPFRGELQDDGELLELQRPDAPNIDGVPMIVVDAVRYNDVAPWPTGGASIERIYANQFGNDPVNWIATTGGATPGRGYDGNRPPSVRVAADQALVSGRFPAEARLSAEVADDGLPADPGQLTLRWTQVAGPFTAIIANNASAQTTVNLPGAGAYRFRLSASDGAVETAGEITLTVARPPAVADLVPMGAEWSYLDDGTDQGTAWRNMDFNAEGWRRGFAQLGYGDEDETTPVGWGTDPANRYITTYFRRSFTAEDPLPYASLRLRYVRDDGIVVYLNGQEVFRNNMPEGTTLYSSTASTGIAGADESAINEYALPLEFLRPGQNVIAAEIHQFAPNSSDISFDLQLEATRSTLNQRPIVNAGPDANGIVGMPVALNGSATDDGLPASPGVISIAWNSESGPGPVSYGNRNAARTTATFSVAGSYVLRLSAVDGQLAGVDTVAVTVFADNGYGAWAARNFTASELSNPNVSGPSADPDSDTFINQDEFVAGTNPKDGASVLRLRATATGTIRFDAMPNVSYTILFRALNGSVWQPAQAVPAQPGQREVEVQNPQPGFYQVSIP